MKWQDSGLILKVSKYRDRDAVAVVFTENHGKYSGLLRGGLTKRNMRWLLPWTEAEVTWQARLTDHLGAFKLEPINAYFAKLAQNRCSLAALVAVRDLLLTTLPDRENQQKLFQVTRALLASIEKNPPLVWLTHYVKWEFFLLQQLGYAPNLTAQNQSVTKQYTIHQSDEGSIMEQNQQKSLLLLTSLVLRKNYCASNAEEISEVLDFLSTYFTQELQIQVDSRNTFLQLIKQSAA